MTDYAGKNVLVTGADGFIGSHLATSLVQAGASVTALCQYNSFGSVGWLDDIPESIRQELTVVSGDIRDPHFVRLIAVDKDVVFHLAALIAIPYSYVAPQSYVDVNITGTLNILEACRVGDVGRMVHTSTSEVYGTAIFMPITEAHPLQGQSPYSASKIAADHMVEAYYRSFDTPAVIMRPFNTYGPRQSERADQTGSVYVDAGQGRVGTAAQTEDGTATEIVIGSGNGAGEAVGNAAAESYMAHNWVGDASDATRFTKIAVHADDGQTL